jgi:peptidoglycan hydrolase-like protein with peptidoglycan-binding domain
MLIARRSERDLIRSTQTMLGELKYEIGEIDGYMGPTTRNIMKIYQRIHGLKQTDDVSAAVLDHLSRATGRGPARDWHIYVKQEFGDLFDAPIEIRDPDQPTGTHLFQAQEFTDGATSVRWTVLPGDEASAAFAPAGVLDRIEIPAETRDRIAKLLTPGSSLIVTDQGKSDEVNEYTSFLVKLPVPGKSATSVASVEESDDEPAQAVRTKRKKRAARAVRTNSRASVIASRHVRSVQR